MVFEAVVVQLLEWLGVEWSAMQIRETAELMSSEYHWMSLAEIKGFTAKIKAGHFGKEWGKLRPMMLMGWMLDWSADLLDARAGKIGQAKPVMSEEEAPGTIDITDRLGPVMDQLQSDLTKQREADAEEQRKKREEQQERLFKYLLSNIASRIGAGEELRNEQEIEFYNENKDVIDQLANDYRLTRNR
jgi:hypothetical protein